MQVRVLSVTPMHLWLEWADAVGLKSTGRDTVGVRVPPSVPKDMKWLRQIRGQHKLLSVMRYYWRELESTDILDPRFGELLRAAAIIVDIHKNYALLD